LLRGGNEKEIFQNGDLSLSCTGFIWVSIPEQAKKFSVDPSYVSRVANGARENEEVKAYLIDEIIKLADNIES
jgi:hypothetical protein